MRSVRTPLATRNKCSSSYSVKQSNAFRTSWTEIYSFGNVEADKQSAEDICMERGGDGEKTMEQRFFRMSDKKVPQQCKSAQYKNKYFLLFVLRETTWPRLRHRKQWSGGQ